MMTRKQPFLAVLSLSLALILAWSGPVRGQNTPPPNVLVIFSDDQRADTIAALGNPLIKTPALDGLVKRGLSFTRAYMQGGMNGATCVPSRAMLLSGQNLFHIDEKLQRDRVWPQAFAAAGYTTFVSGKWHNGDASLVSSFQIARSMFTGGMTDPSKAMLRNVTDGKVGPPKLSPKHACEVFADEAIRFLNEPRKGPFFAYVPFDAPHDPHVVPADFPVKYTAEEIPLPPNFLPTHPFDNGELVIRDEKLLPTPRTPKAIQQMLADYYRYVSYLDAQIGRVLDALAASPAAKNTLVVYASDSGVARGSHGLIGKQNLYEHSVRVPLILAGPGIPEDKRTDALCYLFDVLPTLGKKCGIASPNASDAIDLSPAIENPTYPVRKQLLFAYKDVQRAVTDGKWKLISYPKINRTSLFDLASDPHEIKDLAAAPSQAETLSRMKTLLISERIQAGDHEAGVAPGK